MKTVGKCEITKTCCRISAEKGKKGEFERNYILLQLRIGMKPKENERDGAGGITLCPFQKTWNPKCRNAGLLSERWIQLCQCALDLWRQKAAGLETFIFVLHLKRSPQANHLNQGHFVHLTNLGHVWTLTYTVRWKLWDTTLCYAFLSIW